MARYIDADKLREYWLENGVNENVYNTNNVLDSIDYQSTADVEEVKYGKWLQDFDEDYYCSACGSYPKKDVYNYCPHCGAKMDGERSDA